MLLAIKHSFSVKFNETMEAKHQENFFIYLFQVYYFDTLGNVAKCRF